MIDLDSAESVILDGWLRQVRSNQVAIQAMRENLAAGANMINPATKAAAYITWGTIRQLGEDQVDRDPNIDDPAINDISASGLRMVTLHVRMDSWSQTAGETAQALAEQAMIRLRLPAVREALMLGGVAVSDVTPIESLPHMEGERANSRAAFDVFLCLASNFEDEDNGEGTIGSVEYRSANDPNEDPPAGIVDIDGQPTQTQIEKTITE